MDKAKPLETYQPATLHAPKSGTWLVIWYNIHPSSGALTRVRKTFGLNRIADVKQRRELGNHYVALINTALRNGWNFFETEEGKQETVEAARPKLSEVLDYAERAHLAGLEQSSRYTYRSKIGVFQRWLIEEGYADKPAADFLARDYQAFVQHRLAIGKTNRNVNSYTDVLQPLFACAVAPLGLLPLNPLERFPRLHQGDGKGYDLLTAEELSTISDYLAGEHPRFLLYLKHVLYAFIRPAHIGYLRPSSYNFARGTLTIQGEETKGDRTTTKQVLPELMEALLDADTDRLPPEWFIFSNEFAPGPNYISTLHKIASVLWKELVIDGLGIPKKMYALKHTGATAYIDTAEHVDVIWLQHQLEHASLQETERYIAKRRVKILPANAMKLPKF